MPTSYPGAVDAFTRPGTAEVQGLSVPPHSVHHDNAYDAIEAIQAKLGIGADVAAVNEVLRGTGAGATAFGAIQTADLAANAVTQRMVSPPFTGTRSAAGYADVDSTNGKITYTSTGGDLLVFFSGYVLNSNASVAQSIALRLDAGAELGGQNVYSFPGAASYPLPFCAVVLFPAVSAGVHSVFARHQNITPAGTMTTQGTIVGVEFKR